MKKPQPRDRYGRFKRRYVRPPKLGTWQRILWDAADMIAEQEIREYDRRMELYRRMFQGKQRVIYNASADWRIFDTPTSTIGGK
jgi:anaerobic selenocysteine-containing dehydrogenase